MVIYFIQIMYEITSMNLNESMNAKQNLNLLLFRALKKNVVENAPQEA